MLRLDILRKNRADKPTATPLRATWLLCYARVIVLVAATLTAVLVAATLTAVEAYANTIDTLTSFNSSTKYKYYRIPDMSLQAARFQPRAACQLTRISIILAGDSANGSARVRLFGNEGGAVAPYFERDIVQPILIRKTQRGIQRVDTVLSLPVDINYHQFFIAVDSVSEGVLLVSDSEKKEGICSDEYGTFGYQCIKTKNGQWWTTPFGYGISAIVEYATGAERNGLVDVTLTAGFVDALSANRSIAWGDYDNDTYLDLLVGGQLWRNNGDGTFRNISSEIGLLGTPKANLFLDIDIDGRQEILFLGTGDSTFGTGIVLFKSDSGNQLRRMIIADVNELVPTSFSVADANNDGYPDLFIGQGRDRNGKPQRNLLLINNRTGGLTDRSDILYTGGYPAQGSQGSQWVDVDNDGYLDLFVANQGANACELWRNNGDGSYSMVCGPAGFAPEQILSVNALGGHWGDVNRDGYTDLLLTQHTTLAGLFGDTSQIDLMLVSKGKNLKPHDEFYGSQSILYTEMQGSGVWADIDNSGTLDATLLGTSDCRHMDIYLQDEEGNFELSSHEFGLLQKRAGPCASWADYDNDGRLDLATFVDGRFQLLRNTTATGNAYLQVDPVGANSAGMKIEVYAGGHPFVGELASGRGLLVQDPSRIHIGLGDAARIDSVVVRWPDGEQETIVDAEINSLLRLPHGRERETTANSSQAVFNVRAYPNPFSEQVEIVYELASETRVTLEIYDATGNRVRVVVDGIQNAGIHKAVWSAIDDAGKRIGQGTYIYRIVSPASQVVGSIMLRK